MPDHLLWLYLSAGLGAVLWVPYVIGLVSKHGLPTPEDYRTIPAKEVPFWVKRADRVLVNFIENFSVFAALVIIAHLLFNGSEPFLLAKIAFWGQVFFWGRLAHAIVYWFGIAYLRTLFFMVGWIAVIAIFILIGSHFI